MQSIKNSIIQFWAFLKPPPQTIFIMAQARSGSSLLEHIISSNKEILGAGEQRRIYRNKYDIKKMELWARKWNRKIFNPYTYVVDQVLHNTLTPNSNLLTNSSTKIIFLIRKPEESIASIDYVAKDYNKNNLQPFNASKYYKERITYLVNTSKQIPKKNQFFLTYHDLVYNTNSTLKKLSVFLNLKTPLTKNYKTKKNTTRFGDPSNNIKKGTVFITEKKEIKLDCILKMELDKIFNEACIHFKNNN